MRVNPVGFVIVLFGFGNLAITRWVMARRRDGRPLPRMLRTWEIIGRMPRVAVVLACCEIAAGILITANLIDF